MINTQKYIELLYFSSEKPEMEIKKIILFVASSKRKKNT
jgi:hypothetical protein